MGCQKWLCLCAHIFLTSDGLGSVICLLESKLNKTIFLWIVLPLALIFTQYVIWWSKVSDQIFLISQFIIDFVFTGKTLMVQLNQTTGNNFFLPKAEEILIWYFWPSGDLLAEFYGNNKSSLHFFRWKNLKVSGNWVYHKLKSHLGTWPQ